MLPRTRRRPEGEDHVSPDRLHPVPHPLHDARATDLVTAIRLHGGEASGVRTRFSSLAASQKADLIAFLRSL